MVCPGFEVLTDVDDALLELCERYRHYLAFSELFNCISLIGSWLLSGYKPSAGAFDRVALY
ncbi:hypothetical protein C0053_03445 [Pseudomonas aeruginosa]|uniref:Uncharacterized protein n=1 Tax=Pseudomonas aeruginosa TaxID=287 RepID=A0A2V3F869_PSEAI|nr:hypothetical protein PA1088_02221 [Pseudomonas aeruginosa]AOX32587.1 hypothetical protein PA8281_04631 [Pseudomonas aeruginosa]AOX39207.1 hypothetical protein PA11803_01073 [Pseudomonas aeruginosa]APB56675.1 hypothetical protein PA7790_00011 [Pseudomonas aeruginosa]ARU38497.1 hypothetical protein AL347_29150 [Pseudomonas aeruginosa]